MTKSRPSAIKLRLSRLVRCLVALGCLKLLIMFFALFELPMPAWQGDEKPVLAEKSVTEESAKVPEITGQASVETVSEPPAPENQPAQEQAEIPQGSAAAELAAAARPQNTNPWSTGILPTPLLVPNPAPVKAFSPRLPTPGPLGAPLAKAGIILPGNEEKKQAASEDSIWNILNLKSLPVPGLGSAQAAHAAALDMPVPNTPSAPSPFAPAEQMVPGQPTVLPGAPPLPANIPHGQSADGSPLPPRQYTPGGSGFDAPAPSVQAQPSPLDPNVKNQELARQQQDILMLRQQMDQRLKDLQNAEDKMKGILREAKDAEDKKVRTLIQMYANMKPRMAAQAMEKMDERIAVRILAGMAPKQSGEILTYTNPAKTAKFTEMITRLRTME